MRNRAGDPRRARAAAGENHCRRSKYCRKALKQHQKYPSKATRTYPGAPFSRVTQSILTYARPKDQTPLFSASFREPASVSPATPPRRVAENPVARTLDALITPRRIDNAGGVANPRYARIRIVVAQSPFRKSPFNLRDALPPHPEGRVTKGEAEGLLRIRRLAERNLGSE